MATLVFDGRLAGIFEGFAPGRLYTLDNGVVWEQLCDISVIVCRESPRCRLLWDAAEREYLLEVAGVGVAVAVQRR